MIPGMDHRPSGTMRRVVSDKPDPNDGRRSLFTLDCGHVVNRRNNGSKRRALCEQCGPGPKPTY